MTFVMIVSLFLQRVYRKKKKNERLYSCSTSDSGSGRFFPVSRWDFHGFRVHMYVFSTGSNISWAINANNEETIKKFSTYDFIFSLPYRRLPPEATFACREREKLVKLYNNGNWSGFFWTPENIQTDARWRDSAGLFHVPPFVRLQTEQTGPEIL